MKQSEIYMFDLDGTISITRGTDYTKSKPNKVMVKKVNELFESGFYIKIFTARGTLTGKDWRELTEQQLKDWGVQYHELIFGKPVCNFYVGDEAISVKDFLRLTK